MHFYAGFIGFCFLCFADPFEFVGFCWRGVALVRVLSLQGLGLASEFRASRVYASGFRA